MEKVDWRIGMTAIVGLCVVQIFAMYFGINGTFRTIACAIIAGIAGLSFPSPFSKIKSEA